MVQRRVLITGLVVCSGLLLLIYCFHDQFGNLIVEDQVAYASASYTGGDTVNYAAQQQQKAQGQFQVNGDEKEESVRATSPKVISYDKIVFVIAYMRTGSSLTGRIFESYPGAFYLREPLKGKSPNDFFTDPKKEDKMVVKEVKHLVQCEFEKTSFWVLKKYLDSSACDNEGSKGCQQEIQTLKNKCKQAKMKVLKFIRLRVRNVLELLPLFPNLYLIHLVRDPRGMFNSRMKLTNKKESDYKTTSFEGQCNTVFSDLQSTKKIFLQYPERVEVVRYEDMAKDPMQTWKTIIDFCKLDFKKEMKDFIRQVTSANHDACSLCVRRKDSVATSNQWRNELEPGFGRTIYESCRKMSEVLGYLPFKTDKDQHDMKRKSMEDTNIFRNLLKI